MKKRKSPRNKALRGKAALAVYYDDCQNFLDKEKQMSVSDSSIPMSWNGSDSLGISGGVPFLPGLPYYNLGYNISPTLATNLTETALRKEVDDTKAETARVLKLHEDQQKLLEKDLLELSDAYVQLVLDRAQLRRDISEAYKNSAKSRPWYPLLRETEMNTVRHETP